MFNPVTVQVSPFAALAFWLIVGAAFVGLWYAITLGGAVVFTLMVAAVVVVGYFAVRRVESYLAGGL